MPVSTRRWLDTDGNITNTANWSGATLPVSGDTVIIDEGDKDIVTNVDQSAVTDVNLRVGGEFAGTIGTSAAPLKFGTSSGLGTVIVDAPLCRAFHFQPAAIATAKVYRAHANPYAFNFLGTCTAFHAIGGTGIRLGATAVVTTLALHSLSGYDLLVAIEAAAALTTIRQLGGYLNCAAAFTTLNQSGGTCEFDGDTAKTGAALNMWGGLFLFTMPNGVLTAVNVYGGKFDASRVTAPRTITNGELWAPGQADLGDSGTVVQTNPWTIYGGTHRGFASPTVVVEPRI